MSDRLRSAGEGWHEETAECRELFDSRANSGHSPRSLSNRSCHGKLGDMRKTFHLSKRAFGSPTGRKDSSEPCDVG